MGKHQVRSPVVRRLIVTLVIVLVGTGVAGAAWFTVDRLRAAAAECASITPLSVVASPDIASVVGQVAATQPAEDSGNCYRVELVARDSALTSDWLAQPGATGTPTVWIPDSTVWMHRAREKGATQVPETGTSIATSPVVMAMAQQAAKARGWPEKLLTWSDAVGPGGADLTVGMPDPSVDAVGVSALIAVRSVTAQSADPPAANVSALRKVSPNAASGSTELFDRLSGAKQGSAPAPTAFPTSERALLQHNAERPAEPLVAVYPNPASPSLDYPFVTLPGSPEAAAAAAKFRVALLSSDANGALAKNGLRSPDGNVLGDPPADNRTIVRMLRPVSPPRNTEVDQILNTWAGVNRASRIQAVLDVSGSMNQVIPGSSRTRMAVTLAAAEQGITLMNPRTKLGIWEFATELDGDKDYREVLPVEPITEAVSGGALDKLRAVKAIPNGQTGLYDTTLAAYTSARQAWEPGRINLVLIMTDGRNQDKKSIDQATLLAELTKLRDPNRPMPIVFIGIGPDIDVAELDRIAKATGGQTFSTADPAKIQEIFYTALSKIIGS